jgi:hypothetical protein
MAGIDTTKYRGYKAYFEKEYMGYDFGPDVSDSLYK